MAKARGTWLVRAGIIVFTFLVLLPFSLVVMNSLSAGQSFYSSSVFPRSFTLEHYRELFSNTRFLSWIKNSTILGCGAGLLSMVITLFGGYAFSRFSFRGKKYGILLLLIVQMLPVSLSMVAYFKMLQMANLLNTLTGIILILGFSNAAVGIWLMRNFLNSIPRELDESATLDGAGSFQTLFSILLPLMAPMLLTQFILTFIGVYNEYLLSALLLFEPDKYPLGPGLKSFVAGNYSVKWASFSTAAVMGSIPILLIFYALQRFIVQGLTKGAMKG
ncbi:MAG TPA: ABC transporter permease subunit [Thermotogota bacterium]|nr:ABC transporter permease subunit [Thermotogota bacterium]HRW92111.1 ABC transporter permease subunit [Thermotogota bacterium]